MSEREGFRFTLGGRERVFRYPMAAFVAAQVRYGVRVGLETLGEPSVADLVVYAWIGLLHDEPRLKLQTVSEWIDDPSVDRAALLENCLVAVAEAFRLDVPEAEGERAAEPETLDAMLDPTNPPE